MRLLLDVDRNRSFHENEGIGKKIHNFGGTIIYGLRILSMVDFRIELILNQIFVSVELAHDMLPDRLQTMKPYRYRLNQIVVFTRKSIGWLAGAIFHRLIVRLVRTTRF